MTRFTSRPSLARNQEVDPVVAADDAGQAWLGAVVHGPHARPATRMRLDAEHALRRDHASAECRAAVGPAQPDTDSLRHRYRRPRARVAQPEQAGRETRASLSRPAELLRRPGLRQYWRSSSRLGPPASAPTYRSRSA